MPGHFSGLLKRIVRPQAKRPERIRFSREAECRHLYEVRLRNLVQVREPLVLISQIQRSGGTLLSQLFDGHPAAHAHPHELYVGYPKKNMWPSLDLRARPEEWFEILFEKPVLKGFEGGYTKHGRGVGKDADRAMEVYPFVFLPSLQQAIFLQCVASKEIRSDRDVFDCYMTSYFNAWLDNQNLYGLQAKRCITGFVPSMGIEQLARFFGVYPDGRLISMIRDAKGWYASARKHRYKRYRDLEGSIRAWRASARVMLEAKQRYGGRVYIVSFEDLVGDTETTMRALAEYVGIEFSPILLTPTFNGFPIKANSSYEVKSYGVIQEPLSRYRESLSPDAIRVIDRETDELYREVVRLKG